MCPHWYALLPSSSWDSLYTNAKARMRQTRMSLCVRRGKKNTHTHTSQAEQEPRGLGNLLWYHASARCHRNRYTDGEDGEAWCCVEADHVKPGQLERGDQKTLKEERNPTGTRGRTRWSQSAVRLERHLLLASTQTFGVWWSLTQIKFFIIFFL